MNYPPGLLSVIFFPAPGLVPAVTLASTPGYRGNRNCLTRSLSPTLSVRQGVDPVPGPARHDQLTQMSLVAKDKSVTFIPVIGY